MKTVCKIILISFFLISISFSKVTCIGTLSYGGSKSEFPSYISFYSGNELGITEDSISTYALYIVIWFSDMEQFLIKTQYSIYPSVAIEKSTLISLIVGEKIVTGEQINEPYFMDWVIKDFIIDPDIKDFYEIIDPKTLVRKK